MTRRLLVVLALCGLTACSRAPRPESPGPVALDAIFVEQFDDFDGARASTVSSEAVSSEPFRIVSKDGRCKLQAQRDGNGLPKTGRVRNALVEGPLNGLPKAGRVRWGEAQRDGSGIT